ncbi:MAG: hypothetical protein ABFQ95_03395 [Pseudomonadota bacterium]
MRFTHAFIGVGLSALLLGEVQATSDNKKLEPDDPLYSSGGISSHTDEYAIVYSSDQKKAPSFPASLLLENETESPLVFKHDLLGNVVPLIKEIDDLKRKKLRDSADKLGEARRKYQEANARNADVSKRIVSLKEQIRKEEEEKKQLWGYINDGLKELHEQKIEGFEKYQEHWKATDEQKRQARLHLVDLVKEDIEIYEEDEERYKDTPRRLRRAKNNLGELRPKLKILSTSLGTREEKIKDLEYQIVQLRKGINSEVKGAFLSQQEEHDEEIKHAFVALDELLVSHSSPELSSVLNPALLGTFKDLKINAGKGLTRIFKEYIAPSCPLLSCLTPNEEDLDTDIGDKDWNGAITKVFLEDREKQLKLAITDMHNGLRDTNQDIVAELEDGQSLLEGQYLDLWKQIEGDFGESLNSGGRAKESYMTLFNPPYSSMILPKSTAELLENALGNISTFKLTLMSLRAEPELLDFDVPFESMRIQERIHSVLGEEEAEDSIIAQQQPIVAQGLLRVWGLYFQTVLLQHLPEKFE